MFVSIGDERVLLKWELGFTVRSKFSELFLTISVYRTKHAEDQETKKETLREYSSSEASASSSGEDSDKEEEIEYEDIPLSEKEKNELSAKILRAELMGDDVSLLLSFTYSIEDCPRRFLFHVFLGTAIVSIKGVFDPLSAKID